MKKIYLTLVAFVFLSALIKAQVKAYSFPSVILTEEIIAQRLDESRKKGVQEWEIENLNKGLIRLMKSQQHNLALGIDERATPPQVQASCTNIDFEDGSYSGWTLTSGNINGVALPCNTCATSSTGGIAAVTTSSNSGTTWSSGVDLCTNLPALAPGGGVYSLCLNNNATLGKMQEIKQAFSVTATNNVFIYQYLAILQDGQHAASDQPYFMSQVLDGSGNVIPCTYVLQSAAASISGWTAAPGCTGTNYKGWVTVTLDLTSYIGQNVTIDFLVSDCNQGGHFGYAYIDASCNQIQANNAVSVCPPSAQLCGPSGFNTYSWSGPVTGSAMCLNGATAGAYTLVTTGQCPAPTRYYTVTIAPTPTVNFNYTVTPCNNTVPFVDQSNGGSSTISDWSWDFGDGSAAVTSTTPGNTQNHLYPGPGTYNAVLTCTTSVGCVSSFTTPVTLGTGPTAVFSASTVCPGSPTVFSNTSTGATAYSWNFGDGNVSTVQNPTHTYSGAGSYVATLTVTGTGTCVATTSLTVTVNPLPTITATNGTICNGSGPVTITGGGGSTYTWSTGAINPSISVNPASTTNYTVTGTDANGCVNTATTSVTVISNPTITVANDSICPGATATLSASGATTYAWSGPNLNATTGITVTATPATTSTYTIVGTAGTCTASTTAMVVIKPSITPTFSAPAVCLGQSTAFTNTTAGASTFNWNFGDGNTSSGNGNPSNTYTAVGSYVVTLSVTTAAGCSGVGTNTIVINANPVPAFSSSTPCQGTAAIFTNTTPANPTISNWSWNFGDANTSTAQSPTNNYASAGIYSTVLSATTSAGCVGTFSVPVIVHPNPIVNFNSTTVCANTPPTTFTDLSTLTNPTGINDNITSWAWAFGDGNTSTTQSPINNYASAGIYTVLLSATTSAGCVGTFTAPVTVHPNPIASFSNTTVCANTPPTVFSDLSTVLNPAGINDNITAWAWNFGNGSTSTATNPSTTYTAAGSYVATLTVTSSAGCFGVATNTVLINANPIPVFSSSTPCQGTAVIFTNTSPANPAISNWSWAFGDGNTSTVQSPTNNYATAGIYTTVLSATTSAGCTGTFSAAVTVHPNPVASFSNTTVCLNTASTAFTDLSTITNPAGINDNITGWAWTFGDGNTATQQNPGNPYTTCGTFNASLIVITNNNCTNTFPLTVTVNCIPVLTPPPNLIVCPASNTASGPFAVDIPGSTISWGSPTVNTGLPNSTGTGNVAPYTSVPQNLSGGNLSDVITAIPTSPAGCVGSPQSFTISVYPTPRVNTMADIQVCDQQQVNVLPFSSYPGGSTFAWNNSNTSIGLGASGPGNIPSFTGTTNGSNIPVVGTISVTPTLNGCVGPDSTFVIIITPQPTITLTSPPLTCPGNTVLAPTYTLNPNDPATTFAWSNSNISTGMPVSGGPTIFGSFTAAPNTTLANIVGTVTVIPTLGVCVGPPATYTVTIYPTPVINPIANKEYCPGVASDSVVVSMIPLSGGTQLYSWTSPTGATIGLTQTTGTLNIPSFNTINAGATAVSSQVIVSGGLDGCPALPITFNITINPNPKALFSVNSKICEGSPMSFTDHSTVGSGSITQWGWDFNNDNVFTDAIVKNPQYILTPAGTHTVGLIVTTAKSCTSLVTEPVYINYNPVPQFAGDVLSGCPIHPVKYSESSSITGPARIISWNWSFGNGSSSTLQSPDTIFYNNSSPVLSAFYTTSLMVMTDSGCVNSLARNNYIEVFPHPLAGFVWGPQDPDPDISNPVIYFTDGSQGASGGGSNIYGPNGMMWYLGDIFLSNPNSNYVTTVQNPAHTYEHYDAYTYYVTQWVQNAQGCKDSVTKPVEIRPTWSFYIPNAFSPNGDGTNDGFKGTGLGIDNNTYNLWIFDRWGMMIFSSNDMEKTWDGRIHGKGEIVQEDVYVWKVKFNDYMGRKHEYNGTVSIIK